MSKRIIILEKQDQAGLSWRFAMWATVPATRQSRYADPTKSSAWKDAPADDLTALRNGQIVERVDTCSVQPGSTMQDVMTSMQSALAAFQSEIDAANPWSAYGSFWDGTAWTNAGVA